MFTGLSLLVLIGIFAGSAGVIWIAGVQLAGSTDILSTRWHLGSALGGIIVLAIATNLPEIAITVSAAMAGEVGVAVGNILGGIAIQTVVLAGMDLAMTERTPLTRRAASLSLVIEGLLVIAVLIVAIMATQLPKGLMLGPVATGAVAIALLWGAGVWLVNRADKGLPWKEASSGQDKPKGHSRAAKSDEAEQAGKSTLRVALVFLAAATATLVAGLLLERSGQAIAGHIGMEGMLFGATVLAAATSLPELSTGIASVRMDDYQLAVSDIFGGNAFLPVLFLPATLISGSAVLPQAGASDIYLAALGVLLTCVYLAGLIFRPTRLSRLGIDSLAVIGFYVIGLVGLFAIAARP